MLKHIAAGLVVLAGALPCAADAQVFVKVPNAAQLSYQTAGNVIYLRNLNQFDSSALGCCYNYWIDTSTQEGKNILAILLLAIGSGQGIWLGLPTGYASGAVTFSGNW